MKKSERRRSRSKLIILLALFYNSDTLPFVRTESYPFPQKFFAPDDGKTDGRRNNGRKKDDDWDENVNPEDLEDLTLEEIQRYAEGLKTPQGSRGRAKSKAESDYPDQASDRRRW